MCVLNLFCSTLPETTQKYKNSENGLVYKDDLSTRPCSHDAAQPKLISASSTIVYEQSPTADLFL